MELFSIRCETCNTALKVRDMAAIGQILSCPKCESMVQVAPPPGWEPPVAAVKQEPEQPAQSTVSAKSIPVDQSEQSAAPPESSGDWQPPFGFEQPAGAPWKAWATGGMLATAAILFGVMTWLWATSGEDELASNEKPPAVAELENREPDTAAKPANGTDESPQVTNEEPPSPEADPPAKTEPKPPPIARPVQPKVEIDPVTGRPAPPASPNTKEPPKTTAEPKIEPLPKLAPNPKADPKLPFQPPPDKQPDEAPPQLTNPLLPSVQPPQNPDPEIATARTDVEDRLNDSIRSIDVHNKPLATVVEEIAQFSTLAITLDLDSLSAVGVTPEDKVSVSLTDTTVGELLERLLDQLSLVYVVESGQVRVISRQAQAKQRRAARYDVADLAADEAAAAHLVKLVKSLIEPSSWQAADKAASPMVALAAGTLTVTHGDDVHRQLARLLLRLRVARGLKNLPPDEVERVLATRYDLIADSLAKKLTVNYSDLPLERVLADLERRSSLVLLIDGLALGQVGLSPDVRATVRTKEPQPVFLILDRLLSPLEVAYRIVDAKTLQVTSRQVAAGKFEIEFFLVKDLADKPAAAVELIGQIKQEIFPESWTRERDPPAIEFDAASHCLIVSHNQYVQVMVQGYLNTLRRPTEVREPGKAE